MPGRRRPVALETAATANDAADYKLRNHGWREESVLREVCHHLKWAQEMKDMYERQVAACQKQLQEHQEQSKLKSGAAGVELEAVECRASPRGDGEMESLLPSPGPASRHRPERRRRRRQHASKRGQEGSKLPYDKPQSKPSEKPISRISGKGNANYLPMLHPSAMMPTPQGRTPVNLVQLPTFRSPATAHKAADEQLLRQTVKPSLFVHHLLQVKVPEDFETCAGVDTREASSTRCDQQCELQLCEAPEASLPAPPHLLAEMVSAVRAEDKAPGVENNPLPRRRRKKKAKRDEAEQKPARKKKKADRRVEWLTGAKSSGPSCETHTHVDDHVSDTPAGVKDCEARREVEIVDDASDASDGNECEEVVPKFIWRGSGRHKARRSALTSSTEASQDILACHPRLGDWSSIFKRLQDDGEVHCDLGPWALQLAGYPKPNKEWAHEILKRMTPYSTLDLHEFVSFMQMYEIREHEALGNLFAECDLDRNGTIDMDELSLMMAAFGVTPMGDVIREIVQDVSPADENNLTFDEFWQVVLNLRAHEGFSKSEVNCFKSLFHKYDVSQTGTIGDNELFRMLAYMGYAVDPKVTQSILHEVDVDNKGSLDEREFLVCMRKVREHEVAKVQEIFHKCDTDKSGGISYVELLPVIRSLGYFPEAEDLLDAYADAGLDPKNEMLLGDLWKFLHTYREREGFSRKEMDEITEIFHRFDEDDSGTLDTTEVIHMFAELGIPLSCNEVQVFVSNVDIDGSGSINLREFTKMFRQHCEFEAVRARDEFCLNAKGSASQFTDMLRKLVPAAFDHDLEKTVEDLNCAQEVNGSIDQFDFVSKINELHLKARRSRLDNHGFSQTEITELRVQFAQYDLGQKGFLLHREVHHLLEHLFPQLSTCAAWRPQLLEIMKNAKIQGSIDFDSFQRLVKKVGQLDARAIIQREKEAIAKGQFSVTEVKEFRDLFIGSGNRDSLSLPEIREMLSRVIPMGYKNSQAVDKVFSEIVVERDGKLEAEFSEFLLILRRLLDSDVASINECARRASGFGELAELS